MRLSEHEILAIKQTFLKYFDDKDELWLFGSRIDDQKKGGDIDLYVYTKEPDIAKAFNAKISFLVDVKLLIGDQKIDMVIHAKAMQDAPIYQEARKTGVKLI
jgi:predicted nucleotidyltransferase